MVDIDPYYYQSIFYGGHAAPDPPDLPKEQLDEQPDNQKAQPNQPAYTPLDLPDSITTSLPLIIEKQLQKIPKERDDGLFYQQRVFRDFYVQSRYGRGALAYWGVGQGKTKLTNSTTELLRKLNPRNVKRIVLMTAKGLAGNMAKGLRDYMVESEHMSEADADALIGTHYQFVSSNSSNMIQNLVGRPDDGQDEVSMALDDKLDRIPKNLEHSVIIIDEAHNLFNAIANNSKRATEFYDLVMKTKHIKLLFLTGTPVVNDPFELAPCFNMLAGYVLFPEKPDIFDKYFKEYIKGDHAGTKAKNIDKFKQRIYGLVSYFGKVYNKEDPQPGFPKEMPLDIQYIPMSKEQFAAYAQARAVEKHENVEAAGKARKPRVGDRFRQKGASTSYRIRSRQMSNCLPESNILWEVKSPKMVAIYNKMQNELPAIVYSNFVNSHGLLEYANYLRTQKVNRADDYQPWSLWIPEDHPEYFPDAAQEQSAVQGEEDTAPRSSNQKTPKSTFNIDAHKRPKYAIISGDVDHKMRLAIQNAYNAGNNIQCILLSGGAGAEGLDLHRTCSIHLMEPYWNWARISQVIARGVRYGSHKDLPKELQVVYPHIYISVPPKGIKGVTTDQELFQKAMNEKTLINAFERALIEGSVDCPMHARTGTDIKCLRCKPTGETMFDLDIYKHISTKSKCEEVGAADAGKKIVANEILVDDIKYFYTKDDKTGDVTVFEHSKMLDAWVPMANDNPLYPQIIASL
jgi:hypothetical protein